jgi:hypothetical protein
MISEKQAIIDKLRQDILAAEGYNPSAAGGPDHIGLGPPDTHKTKGHHSN